LSPPRRVSVFALAALFATPALAGAEQQGAAPDTLYTVPPILIEASRVVDDVSARSSFVATVDLGARRHRVEDLSSVLSRLVGVHVRQYGGLGSFATVGIRGSSANQVDVYFDGVPLNDAYTGVSHIGDLPLDGVGRVEVFRGFAPPQLSSSSVGGAINLVPDGKRLNLGASSVPVIEARQSFGSFDTSRLSVSLWSKVSGADFFVHGGHVQSGGDFEYVDDQATPANVDDDAAAVRLNNDFESWNVLGSLSAPLAGEGALSVSYNGLLREQGVPGAGSHQSLSARSDRESHLVNLRVASPPIFSGRLRPVAGGFVAAANERFHDPNGDISLVPQETDNIFRTYGGNIRATLEGRPLPVTIEAYYESIDDRFSPRANLPDPTEGPDRHRTTQRATVSADLFLFEQNVVLSVTDRFVRQTTAFYDAPQQPWLPPMPEGESRRKAQSPQVGFRWHPAAALTVKGNWARAFRQPTMLELFGNTGSIAGTPDLVPEEGINRDIGVVATFDAGEVVREVFVEVVYLDNAIDNLIVFFPNSQFTSRPVNISSARITGWEVSLSSLLWDRLRLAGNYARLDGRDTGPVPFYNGNWLPGRPRDEATVSVDYAVQRWIVSYELQIIGKNYLDPANMTLVPGREIHGAAVRWSLLDDKVALSAEARNITNNQLSDVNGFPLPGKSFFLTLGVQSKTLP
jgi:iron complex outermembrane receptor protein